VRGLERVVFSGLIESVWSAHRADLVFLFKHPHEKDRLTREEKVRSGYEILAGEYQAITIAVPLAGPEETTDFILASLRARELLA
jgi:hypothetical protein